MSTIHESGRTFFNFMTAVLTIKFYLSMTIFVGAQVFLRKNVMFAPSRKYYPQLFRHVLLINISRMSENVVRCKSCYSVVLLLQLL